MAVRLDSGRPLHLITGGGGYVGCRLALYLVKNGIDVLLLDLIEPKLSVDEAARRRISFRRGDITDFASISDHFRNVSAVYHLASYGMSGKEQFHTNKIKLINVQGTHNVVKACILNNVERLVYASTFNVVFYGKAIENGDEFLPYRDIAKESWDHYACTKTLAEQAVLSANGTCLGNGRLLMTCAIRLAGIYGPGERRHIPRAANVLARGLFIARIGSNPVTELVHVDNVVSALALAEQALSPKRKHVAAGQAYFISDGKPVDSYEFFRPLADALDVRLPRHVVPVWMAYYFGFLVEILYRLLHRFYDFDPLISRAEVYKIGVTHHFSLEKARRQLLYEPLFQNDLSEVAEFYRQMRQDRVDSQGQLGHPRAGSRQWLLNVLCFVALMFVLLSFLPVVL